MLELSVGDIASSQSDSNTSGSVGLFMLLRFSLFRFGVPISILSKLLLYGITGSKSKLCSEVPTTEPHRSSSAASSVSHFKSVLQMGHSLLLISQVF